MQLQSALNIMLAWVRATWLWTYSFEGHGMEDLVRYLDEIVEPSIRDFEKDPMSVRHAFIACVVVFHAVDYLAYPHRSRTLRERFGKESPDFKLVDRVAHAFKHVVTDGLPSQRVKAVEVISRPPAIWGQMVWGLSRWADATGGVTLDSDRNVDLLGVVKRAAKFLREQTKDE